jgi:hypothetical protein
MVLDLGKKIIPYLPIGEAGCWGLPVFKTSRSVFYNTIKKNRNFVTQQLNNDENDRGVQEVCCLLGLNMKFLVLKNSSKWIRKPSSKGFERTQAVMLTK